jgi:hypothetical protein
MKAKTAKKRAKPKVQGRKVPDAEAKSELARGDEMRKRAAELLGRLSLHEVKSALPVLEKYALGVPVNGPPTVPFEDVVEAFDVVTDLIDSREMESSECGGMGCFISNEGTQEEVVEATLALVPIARRVKERWDQLQRERAEEFKKAYDEAEKKDKAGAVPKVKKATAGAGRRRNRQACA